jgi:multidrug efflux pump subunit AcrB
LRDKGQEGIEAVINAGVARFRPIMLTTLTTIVGLTPMLFERSIQAKFLIPVVVSLCFGVLIAFFVTLLLVPALYAIGVDVTKISSRVKNRFRRGGGKAEPDSEPTATGAH